MINEIKLGICWIILTFIEHLLYGKNKHNLYQMQVIQLM